MATTIVVIPHADRESPSFGCPQRRRPAKRSADRSRCGVKANEYNADICDVLSPRTVLAAFLGALGWFIWTVEHQSVSACFSGSHYLPSGVLALAVIVGFVLRSHRPWRPDARRPLLIDGVATAIMSATSLLAASYFAAVLSCTGG